MGVEIRRLQDSDLRAQLEALAFLRIAVFEDYPYLYSGDLEYERRYLGEFASSPGSAIVGAYADNRLVGASTASPLKSQKADHYRPFLERGYDIEMIFYFGESVLLNEYRGQGIGHRFFEEREAVARDAGASSAAFCAVVRSPDHPARPKHYRSLEPFWRKRGYQPAPDLTMTLAWEEHGSEGEIPHLMQFWMASL